MLIAALPLCASRSSVRLPLTASKRPREVEVPKCLISQCTCVCAGSMTKFSGAAPAAAAVPARRLPAAAARSTRRANGITPLPSLLFDRFDLDQQMDVVGQAVVQAEGHAVLRACDRGL